MAQTDIKSLTYLTTQSSRQVVLSLICSLLNTVLKYNPASWRVPLDLTAVTKDPKQQLVTYSLQLLLILIIYPVPQDEPNAFRKALSRLHRAEDFQFIQQGLTTVLTQPVSVAAMTFSNIDTCRSRAWHHMSQQYQRARHSRRRCSYSSGSSCNATRGSEASWSTLIELMTL